MTTDLPAHRDDIPPAQRPLPGWTGWLIWLALLAALLTVFGMYLQPDFLLTLADQVWSCL